MDCLEKLPSTLVENGLARLVWGAIARYHLPWNQAKRGAMTTRITFKHIRNGNVLEEGIVDGPTYPLVPFFDKLEALGRIIGRTRISVRVRMNDAEHEVANY